MGRSKEKGGLGFRDLEMFNLALLAIQGWRLIQNPDTLVATIFREKYYPNGKFLESNLGHRPLYAWRSIWTAKSFLQEGAVWRVGNGQPIRIREDRWLPNSKNFANSASGAVINQDARVSELLNLENIWWKIDVVHNMFNEEEAREICGIVVCPRTRSDQLVWAGEKNGKFSVKSAYHMAKEKMAKR
jgi:hypothetical protein